METFTFNYKTKVEQFQEQFPELYQEIYNLGYRDGQAYGHYSEENYQDYPAELDEGMGYDEDNNPSYYELEYAKPEDGSPRYCLWDSWQLVYERAEMLEAEGYKAGNKDWKEFMQTYKDWKQWMYIAWNPTHKQFAVESDSGVIDENYPHLVDASNVKDNLST